MKPDRIQNLCYGLCFTLAMCLWHGKAYGQSAHTDTLKLDYQKIYALCLDANVGSALPLIDVDHTRLSEKDQKFKIDFEKRFKGSTDSSHYVTDERAELNELLTIFIRYWRRSLLDTGKNYHQKLALEAVPFLKKHYPPVREIDIEKDSIGTYLSRFIRSKGLYTTQTIGKTGKLFDLLIWSSQKDSTYSFTLPNEKITVKVVMMEDFITLGWEEYATLGRYYPGGWATDEALYCVKNAYDLSSEDFQFGYLAHEGRHYADYKLFPKLTSADLEYRAKLTELSLSKIRLYDIIEFFIHNSNYDSDNGHSIANYCVIRDLSKKLFGADFEKDIEKWKKAGPTVINTAANTLLDENTKALHRAGADVERYIKKSGR